MFLQAQQLLLESLFAYGFYGFFIFIYIFQTEPMLKKMSDKKLLMRIASIVIAYKFFIFTMEVIFKWS